jgi:hypothetical protein
LGNGCLELDIKDRTLEILVSQAKVKNLEDEK